MKRKYNHVKKKIPKCGYLTGNGDSVGCRVCCVGADLSNLFFSALDSAVSWKTVQAYDLRLQDLGHIYQFLGQCVLLDIEILEGKDQVRPSDLMETSVPETFSK